MKKNIFLLSAIALSLSINAQTTLPRPIYTLDFEGASTVGDFGGIQHGEGALVKSDDENFGTYYQNMPNGTTATFRTNFLEVPTTAWTTIHDKETKTLSIGFWVNATVANEKNIGNYWGPLFNGYNESGCAGATWLCAYEVRYGGQIHGNSGAYYDNNHDAEMVEIMKWSAQDTLNPDFKDNWHYFTTVYSNIDQPQMNYKLYIDGELKLDVDEEIHNNPVDMWTGTSYLDRFCIGGNSFNWSDPDNAYAYDDIAFYADELSQSQISLIMNIKRNELTEEDKLAVAQAQLEDAIIEAETFQAVLSEGGFPSMANEFGDYLMEIDVYSCETIEAVNAQMTEIVEKQNGYTAVVAAYNEASATIDWYNDFCNKTVYEGAEDFSQAIATATEAIADPTSVQGISETMAQLTTAQRAYVFSQTGDVIDVTRVISAPWFVKETYEPTLDEAGTPTFPDEAGSNLSQAGWTMSYSENLRGATDCTLYFTNGRTTANLFHSSTAVGGVLDLQQTITGLTAGYYEVSADMSSTSAPTDNRIYATANGITKISTTPTSLAWNGAAEWEKLVTDKVLVGEDGTLTIGATSTTDGTQYKGWFCVTNFQLKYYGTEYDLTDDLGKKTEEVKAAIEALTWPGDKRTMSEALAAITDGGLSDYEMVSQLTNLLSRIQNVAGQEAAFTALNDLNALRDVETSEAVKAIWTIAVSDMEEAINSDETTSDAIPGLNALYAAYVGYAEVARGAETWGTTAVTSELESQIASLSGATAEMLEENGQKLTASMKASITDFEASEENPKDVTAFVGNPSFDSDLYAAWNIQGAYAVQQAEIEFYNNSFNLYQTITDMPAGKYMLVASGFYRDGSDYAAVVSNYHTPLTGEALEEYKATHLFGDIDGATPEGAYDNLTVYDAHANMTLYMASGAKKVATPFVSIASDSIAIGSEEDDTYLDYYGNVNHVANFYTTLDNTADPVIYYPYWMWDAFDMVTNRSKYADNAVVFNLAHKSSLTIGVEKSTTIAGDWSIVDNFKLYYIGQADAETVTVEDITALIALYLEENSNVSINEITDLIDLYLAQ